MSIAGLVAATAFVTATLEWLALDAARAASLTLRFTSASGLACTLFPVLWSFGYARHQSGVMAIILVACTSVCALTDLQTQIVFDRVVALTVAALLIVALASGSLIQTLIGCALVGSSLAVIWLLTGGRGLGGGDVKLAYAIGAALGVKGGFMALGIAFVSGALVGVVLLVAGRVRRTTALAFVPYLAIGSAAAASLGGTAF
jgi:leader peptidase (prepilin peptidase) / N-methyltransferase